MSQKYVFRERVAVIPEENADHGSDGVIIDGRIQDPVLGGGSDGKGIPAKGHRECLEDYGKLDVRDGQGREYAAFTEQPARDPVFFSDSPRLRPGLRDLFHPDNWAGRQVIGERGVWVSDYRGRLYDAIGFTGCLGMLGVISSSPFVIPLIYQWLNK